MSDLGLVPEIDGIDYSPFDPRVIDDPYPTYRQLRDRAPAYWSPAAETWVLSRHADVSTALRDPETFSSASGVFPTPRGIRMTEALLPMLIMTDPPRHTQLRRLVSKVFTPRRVAELEPTVTRVVGELLDAGPGPGDTWDVVTGLAGPLPAIVIADLLGLPREDRDQFRDWSSTLVQTDPTSGSTGAGMRAAASLYEYFAGHLERRRREPRPDLMSALLAAEVDGERLADEELLGFCLLLLVAGHETTTNLLGSGTLLLAEDPALRHRLADAPALVPAAVEELLRLESPLQGLSRTLTRDVELHGQTLRAGDTVLLLFASANRDERVFADPDRVVLDREQTPHLAFGHGIHFCLGAPLARLEARVALTALLTRHPDWEVDRAGAVRLRSGPIRGWRALPVRLPAARRADG